MKTTKLLGLISLALMSVVAKAQIYQDGLNSTAVVVRDPARQSSTEIDAVIYNPAGTVFMNDGFHASVNLNMSSQNIKDNHSSYSFWSKNKIRNYMPSIQLSYGKDKWNISASFAQDGGYGLWKNDDGIQFLNSAMNNTELNELFMKSSQESSLLASKLSPSQTTISAEDKLDIQGLNFKSRTRCYSMRLGGAYKIGSHFSAYVGAKLNFFSHKYKMKTNLVVTRPSTNERWNYNDYVENVAQMWDNIANKQQGEMTTEIEKIADDYRKLDVANNETIAHEIDQLNNPKKMNGFGITPVIGLDYFAGKFNVGAKYEFKTHVSTSDGYNSFNLPASLSLGGYAWITKMMKIAIGGTMFFKNDNLYGMKTNITTTGPLKVDNASWGEKAKNTYDIAASANYKCLDWLTFSLSGSYHDKGILLCMGPFDLSTKNIHYWSLSGGAELELCKNLKLNAGIGHDFYHHNFVLDKIKTNYDIKGRTNIALGLNYKL